MPQYSSQSGHVIRTPFSFTVTMVMSASRPPAKLARDNDNRVRPPPSAAGWYSMGLFWREGEERLQYGVLPASQVILLCQGKEESERDFRGSLDIR